MKKLKNIPCSNCGKPEVICMGLCRACYSKKQRSTTKGKLILKLYNQTKGIEARKRYLAKQPPKLPKPPKEIKICECGAIAKAKGFCFNCYSKNYRKTKYAVRNKYKKRTKKDKYLDFVKILDFVKNGSTIYDACKKSNIDTRFFYKSITEKQLEEIHAYKSINLFVKSKYQRFPKSSKIESANKMPIHYFDDKIEEQFVNNIEKDCVIFDDISLIAAIQVSQPLSIPEFCRHEDLLKDINRSLSTLTFKEQEVILKYFGINCNEMSLDDMAKDMDLSRERIRQIKEKALRRLRFTPRSKLLKQYLGGYENYE